MSIFDPTDPQICAPRMHAVIWGSNSQHFTAIVYQVIAARPREKVNGGGRSPTTRRWLVANNDKGSTYLNHDSVETTYCYWILA
jgi:hypothetical protein